MSSITPRHRYQIRVGCQLEEQRLRRFDGVASWVIEQDVTTLHTSPLDQSALHGFLGQMRDLNIELVSLERPLF